MTARFLTDAPVMPVRPSATRILLLPALALALLLMMALWFGGEARNIDVLRATVRASYSSRADATNLLCRLADAETAQRGFVITGQPAFLDSFRSAQQDVQSGLDRVDAQFSETPSQRPKVAQLRGVVRDKFVEMTEVIDLRTQRGAPAATAAVATGVGVRLMDDGRAIVGSLIADENRELTARLATVQARNLRIKRIVWALVFVIGALLVGGTAVLWRSRRARYRLECDAYEASVRLQAVFASTIEAIVVLNEAGRVEACNEAAVALLGYSGAELEGRPVLPLLDVMDPERPFQNVVGYADGRLARTHWSNRTARHKDGRPVPVDIALGLMALPDSLRFVATLRDVSERRAGERLKDEFVATVSHELRTPLTSVVGALGLLRAGAVGELPDAARRLVEIAESNSQRLIGLINDILDIEKIGSGRMVFETRPLDLDRVMRSAVESGSGLAEAKGVRLEAVGTEAPVIVSGDVDKLIQVLTNLLSNAIRFSPAGGVVRVVLTREGEEGVIAVDDEGPGVPPAFESRIFERFSQARENNVQGGTGLGLAISREIVNAHGGRIWFGKAASGGARFAFALPVAVATPIEADRHHARLLVCEDQPDIAEVIGRIIEGEGCTVDRVTTARELEAAARSGRYDGIILDLVLPDASGLEAARRLRMRAETRTTPIVVVSGFASASEADPTAAALEVIDWIPKPVDQHRLIAAVRRAVVHSAASRPTLLHIDDDVGLLEVTATTLADQGRVLRATSLASARAVLGEASPDIVILDLGLPDGSGLSLLPELFLADGSAIPTIIYSAEEVLPAVKQTVDAVVVKSRRSLPSLAATIRHMLATTNPDGGAE